MNKAILIGRLTKDPELVTSTNGVSVCKFTLAVNRYNDEVDFLNIVCFKNTAENTAKYTAKGSQVAVFGSIQTRNYEAQDGTRRYVTEIVANEVHFLGSKGSGETSNDTKKATSLQEISGDLPF